MEEKKIYTVKELNTHIKRILESEYKNIWIQGELSRVSPASSGHYYLTLKDDKSQIRIIIWRYLISKIKFNLEEGVQVLIHGELSVYVPTGQYQIIVREIEPAGLGQLALAFEQLKKKLHQKGLFDDSHKKVIPKFPKNIGIITSPTGAAVKDVLRIISRRYPIASIYIYPVPVQGKTAGKKIANAIDNCNKWQNKLNLDIIIITRGGGSLEDLWAFNEEIVAYSIYNSEIPVMSAVGHEIDYMISDFVADKRAPTPSAAAEIVAPDLNEIISFLDQSKKNIIDQLNNRINLLKNNINNISKHKIFSRPDTISEIYWQKLDMTSSRFHRSILHTFNEIKMKIIDYSHKLSPEKLNEKIGRYSQEISNIKHRLKYAVLYYLDKKKNLIEIFNQKLDTFNIKKLLKAGFVLTYKDNKRIRTSKILKKDDKIKIVYHDGETVTQVVE